MRASLYQGGASSIGRIYGALRRRLECAVRVRQRRAVSGGRGATSAPGPARAVLVPDPVDDRAQLAEAAGPLAIPGPQLILPSVPAFPRALFARPVLPELDSRSVDAVAC